MGVVKKYGGSVVYSDDRLRELSEFIADSYDPEESMIVVVSALVGESERLETLGMNFGGVHVGREMDQLISQGEQRTANLLTLGLKARGIPAISLNGFQLGIYTTSEHGKATITSVNPTRVDEELKAGNVVVATGFQGINEKGDLTTFGANYGGSDLTAVALAIAMNYECELYKGVGGIYTIDPKEYQGGKIVPQISYSEMMQLSACGAQVMEPKAVELTAEFGLQVYVGQAFEKEKGGTYLMKDSLIMTNRAITSLAVQDNIAMCTIIGMGNPQETTTSIFEELGRAKVNLDIIIKQKFEDEKWVISFSCGNEQLDRVKDALQEMKDNFNFALTEQRGLVVLSIIGVGLATASGIAVRGFRSLSEENIDLLNVTTSEISISFVINEEDKTKGIVALCQEFDL